jgi:hypothetical protein
MEKFKMLSKEVAPGVIETPETGGCGTGSCPSVLRREDGKFVVVGKRLSPGDCKDLDESGLVKIYDDEFAVVVDPDLLLKAVKPRA